MANTKEDYSTVLSDMSSVDFKQSVYELNKRYEHKINKYLENLCLLQEKIDHALKKLGPLKKNTPEYFNVLNHYNNASDEHSLINMKIKKEYQRFLASFKLLEEREKKRLLFLERTKNGVSNEKAVNM